MLLPLNNEKFSRLKQIKRLEVEKRNTKAGCRADERNPREAVAPEWR